MKKRKKTGEAAMFFEIWNERGHYCQRCGTPLPGPPRSYYFHHRKTKGAHPKMRLDKNNIELVCLDCHPK